MRHVCSLMMALALCAVLAPRAVASEAAVPAIGKTIDGFTLQDFRGKSHALADLKGAKAVVIAMLGVECPMSKLYAPRLSEMAAKYESQGVVFLGVDPNRQDAVTEMGHFAKLHKLTFPFLKDLNNKLADALGASRVPQAFVLDDDRKLRYAGRIDDQYGFQTGSGYAKFKINNHDLAEAIDAVLAGDEISEPITEAKGCLIGRVRDANEDSDITYSNQIARIFQDHCVECHRPGQIGPFALQNYEEAVGWAEMIEEVVRDQRMPPWHPHPKYGKFRNDLSLSAEEKDTIYQWVANGAPQGDPKDLPEPKEYSGNWTIPGGPDAVFYMTEKPVDVPAEGTVDYRYYVVDPGFKEDKWVKMAECMPDNRGVVHHIIVFLKPPKVSLFSDGGDAENDDGNRRERGRGGQASFGQLSGFAPGTRPYVLPDGMAKMIPAGSQFVFQMHYTPNGSPQKDRSAVGLKFVDPSEVTHRVATSNAANGLFAIPPGDPNYKVESERTYGGDAIMLSLFPHMHLRGKDFRYELIYPDGKREIIMDMPRYDFNWQTSYVFDEPLHLPAGTKLHCTAHFDNSEDNPANPDPTITVRWGDQTWEEMMIGWFDIAVPRGTNIADVLLPEDRGRRRRGGQQRPGEAGQ